jgi:predicted transport protein
MGYSNVALKDKIIELHPEIAENGVAVSLVFNEELKTYDVNMKKDKHELKTHLETKDADECMDGKKCIHLGVQLKEFIDNFKQS